MRRGAPPTDLCSRRKKCFRREGRACSRSASRERQCGQMGATRGHRRPTRARPAPVDERRDRAARGQRPHQPRDPATRSRRPATANTTPTRKPSRPRRRRAARCARYRDWAGSRVYPGHAARPLDLHAGRLRSRRPAAGADGVPGRRRLPQPRGPGAGGGGVRHPDRRRRDAADDRRLRHARARSRASPTRSSAAASTTASPTPMRASCWRTCCRSSKPRSAAR